MLFSDLRGAVRRTLLPSHRLGTAARLNKLVLAFRLQQSADS